ncbi:MULTISPECIES: thiol reductant ABC exporter subunit CydC [Nocardia]|uniref:thiol reductant ABC exporter subunit CydC n=1 Tax=Nocardia TaxID=1817 RepID=UPI000D687FDB|nr:MULTISPECIES: thiol reductant ABC exporter subunit CydC [Nocardia]
MWTLLALSPWRILVAVAWGVAALGSALALAALSAWLIARAWEMPPVLALSVAVVSVRALGISRGLARYLERLATHDVALRSMTIARTTVYRTVAGSDIWLRRTSPRETSDPQQVPTADALSDHGSSNTRPVAGAHVPPRRGDLLVRIGSDIDDLGAVVVRVFVPVAVAAILSLAAVAMLATISVPAAAILAGALAITGILAPWLSARAARDAELAVRADRAEFTADAVTVLDHAAELRVAGRLGETFDAAQSAGKRAVAAENAAASRTAWAAAATPLSIGVSVLAALLIGITLYGPDGGAPGAMTPMALTILVLLPLSAFEAVGPLPAAAQALTTSRAALRRLTQLDGAARRPPRTDTSVPRDLDSLLLRFPDLPEARRVAVVGPSGAGKTTLLMYWAGLFDTPRPDATFFAEDAHLFGTSVLENLRVARGDVTAAEAEKALNGVGLGDWLDSLPDGIHTDLVGGAAAVSGGQRRRLLLARALLSPARILLLDEPTEHLEAEAGADLLRDLLDISSGLVEPDRTVVVVTHQPPPDHQADLVLHIDGSGEVTPEFRSSNNPLHAHPTFR